VNERTPALEEDGSTVITLFVCWMNYESVRTINNLRYDLCYVLFFTLRDYIELVKMRIKNDSKMCFYVAPEPRGILPRNEKEQVETPT
jgi:hypothetical protein